MNSARRQDFVQSDFHDAVKTQLVMDAIAKSLTTRRVEAVASIASLMAGEEEGQDRDEHGSPFRL